MYPISKKKTTREDKSSNDNVYNKWFQKNTKKNFFYFDCVSYFGFVPTIFATSRGKGLRPNFTIYKNELDKTKKCLSVVAYVEAIYYSSIS